VYLALALITVACMRTVSGGRTLYWGDILLYFQPMYSYGRHELLQGRVPLWNPYVLCGQPYLANPQMSLLYPAFALLPLLSTWRFIVLMDGVHLFLIGLFMYAYLRRWARDSSAFVGATVFMCSGCVLGRLQFPPMAFALAYLPFMLLCADQCIDRPGLASILVTACGTGLLALAGHPQVAYLSLGIASIYTLFRAHPRAYSGRRRLMARSLGRLIYPWTIGVLAGIALAAVQIIPTLQVLLASPREELTAAQANRFVLDGPHLLTLILPHFFGSPATADYWGPGNAWEPALFIGWMPLVLVAWSLLAIRGRRLVRFWFGAALVALWLAFGNAGGLYWLAFRTLPGLSNFHDPARFLILVTLALSVLTAIGLDGLRAYLRAREPRMTVFVVTLLVAAPLILLAPDWLPTVDGFALRAGPPEDLAVGTVTTAHNRRYYFPQHDVLWRHYVTDGYTDYGPTRPRDMQQEIDSLMPNLGMRFGIESASGYEPVPLAGPAALDGLSRWAVRRNEPNLMRLLMLLGVHTLVLPRAEHLYAPGLREQPDTAGRLGPLRQFTGSPMPPVAWFVHRVLRVEGPTRVAAALAAPQFDPLATAIVSLGAAPSGPSVEPTSSERQAARVKILDQRNDDLVIQIVPTRDARYLVIGRTAMPGWKALGDGRPLPLYRTDGALLGACVPPGTQRIAVCYRPECFQIGLYVSLVMAGGLAAGGVVAMKRRFVPVRDKVGFRVTTDLLGRTCRR
jgi:hypothetical protein